ncbi:MAG: hypothetical protein LUD16_04105 [Lachnospiraceae bacterium]|nr:hypothetical protein [Lachnospiraceae bacterium]
MGQICIKILDGQMKTKAVSRGENEVNLVYSGAYREEVGSPFPALVQIEVYGRESE